MQRCLQNAFPTLADDAVRNSIHKNAGRTKAGMLGGAWSNCRPSLLEVIKEVAPPVPRATDVASRSTALTAQVNRREVNRLVREAEVLGARKQNNAMKTAMEPFAALMAYAFSCCRCFS